ncbi:MAG: hypothetical protein B6U89_07520 [Desulfurococcales archaeon ex4484_58]|nr:MAG: hypothetical protein B6U89_07520 [Desulfurococcales archaeon ex4484_58]
MVLITKIKIENFRGIRKTEIDGLRQVNIFIGRNGVGKSSILEAIYLASAWCKEESDVLKVLEKTPDKKVDYIIYRRGLRGNWNTAREFLWHNLDIEKPIVISLSFNGESSNVLDFIIIYRDDLGGVWLDVKDILQKPLIVERLIEFLREKIIFDRLKIYKEFQALLTDLPLFNYWYRKVSDYTGKRIEEPLLRGKNLRDLYVQVLETTIGDVIRFFNSIIFLDDFLIRGLETYEHVYWKKILSVRADKTLVNMLNEGLETNVDGLSYAPVDSGYVLMVLLKNTSVRIDDLGSGSRDVLVRLMPLVTVKDTAALLEEPENHLHPGGLYIFMKYLLRIAKENNLQLFISTHSIELVTFAYRLSGELGIDTRVFFLEKEEDDTVTYRVLEKIDVDTLRKLGLDPRFLDII